MKLAPFQILALIFSKSLLHSGVATKTRNNEMIANSSKYLKSEEMQEMHDSNLLKSLANYSRVPRNISSTDLPNSTIKITSTEPKVALVKKPIPKFSATDSEDYQAKVNHHVKFLDPVEHEDEDFSIDDYDFDVHHDEFAGRGKPLQPRIKVKVGSRVQSKSNEISKPKIVLPRNIKASDVRNEGEKPKDEYDDDEDSVETTEASQPQKSDYITEKSSKEHEGKSSVRTVRSPLSFSEYFEKLNEKTSSLMSKIFSILPIFPRVLESKKLDKP